ARRAKATADRMHIDGEIRRGVFTLTASGGEWRADSIAHTQATREKIAMSTADPWGKFVWHELLSGDTVGAGAFYPKVVSWKSQSWEHDSSYTLMMSKSGPVGGIMGMLAGLSAAPHWIPYVGVDDPHATVAQAKSMGAKVTKDVSSIPNGGQFAILTDPQGAEFAIYKSSTPANGAAAPGSGDFGWHELSNSDP